MDNIMLELEKPLNEIQIKCVARQMVEGLQYLHNNKVFLLFTGKYQEKRKKKYLYRWTVSNSHSRLIFQKESNGLG